MRFSLKRILIASIGSAIFPFTIYAAKPMSLANVSFNELRHQFGMTFLNSKVSSTAKNSFNNLYYLHHHKDVNRINHIRMQQMYRGFPVLGGYAIAHSRAAINQFPTQSQPITMTGLVYSGLDAELGPVPKALNEKSEIVLKHFTSQWAQENVSEETITPVVYIDKANRAHWAYQIQVLLDYTNQLPQQPSAILDADTELTYVQWDNIKTLRVPVQGRGYGGNEVTGLYQYGVDWPLLDITRDDATSICYMDNSYARVVDLSLDPAGWDTTMHFACMQPSELGSNEYWTGYNSDGYDVANGGYSASNDAFYAGNIVYQMYHDWYNSPPVKTFMGTTKIVLRVHFAESYQNAYWDGMHVNLGDGGARMYPLVTLDIIAHELSHGFTQQYSDLFYFDQAGGINESFSDMAAQAALFFANKPVTWTLAAETLKTSTGLKALRFMDSPALDGHSIESALDFKPDMNVHRSSGVYNRLFYLIATQPGWDVRKAFDVMVKANMDYWTPMTTFDQAACGVLNATRDLGLDETTVQKMLDAVDVSYQTCVVQQVL